VLALCRSCKQELGVLSLVVWDAIEVIGRILWPILELLDLAWWLVPAERHEKQTPWPRRDWWPGP
jgi:hypothetical protein